MEKRKNAISEEKMEQLKNSQRKFQRKKKQLLRS